MQAFLDSSKAHAPFRPLPAAAPPGVALSLPDQLRVRDRSTIMARQLFAEQGAAFADEQVGRLLASLNINPMELPAAGPGQATSWDRIFGAAAGPRLAQPSAASEHAAAAAMAAHHGQQEQWAQEFERMRLGAAGPSSSAAAWAAEHQQQQQPAAAAGSTSSSRRRQQAAPCGSERVGMRWSRPRGWQTRWQVGQCWWRPGRLRAGDFASCARACGHTWADTDS